MGVDDDASDRPEPIDEALSRRWREPGARQIAEQFDPALGRIDMLAAGATGTRESPRQRCRGELHHADATEPKPPTVVRYANDRSRHGPDARHLLGLRCGSSRHGGCTRADHERATRDQ